MLPLLLLWLADPFAAQRERMASEQLEARGVRDARVLHVMRTTPRHRFVPPGLQDMAYADQPLPIGHGATISQPYIVALMTQLVKPAGTHKVLEIGTGSGYQAAVLAQLVRHVFTIELVPGLASSARDTLARMGYSNVTVRQGDGYRGWPSEAPFDGIVLTAAPPEVPQALIDQLAPGGRLIAPVGTSDQQLIVIEKNPDGTVRRWSEGGVRFVPMRPASGASTQ